MDNSICNLFKPKECLEVVCSYQSNLVQAVHEYLSNCLLKENMDARSIYDVLESFSYLLPICPALKEPLITFLVAIENPFENWFSASDLRSWRVLYHLLPYILVETRNTWKWKSLFSFISSDNTRVRFYACQIICSLLNKTESEKDQMERLLMVDQAVVYETTSLMDIQVEEGIYKSVINENRRKFLQRQNSPPMEIKVDMEQEEADNHDYVEICGYIIPCRRIETRSERETNDDSFIMSEASERNMERVCMQLRDKKPILLQGDSGCGKTRLFQELAERTNNRDYIQLYLDDQMDAKSLIGNYVCTDKPGEFLFQPGTLTQAITSGKWIIIEDIDRIPFDIVSTLLPIIEKGELTLTSRGITIPVHPNFRLFGTSCHNCSSNNSPINTFLLNHWHIVDMEAMSLKDIEAIVNKCYPMLNEMIRKKIVVCYSVLCMPKHTTVSADDEYNRQLITLLEEESDHAVILTPSDIIAMKMELLRNGKPITCRDVLKWCKRLASNSLLTTITNSILSEKVRRIILDEALDVFAGCLPSGKGKTVMTCIIATIWNLSLSVVDTYTQTAPVFSIEKESFSIGRIRMGLSQNATRARRFYKTKQSLHLMEQICSCISNQEPMLLVGETGCGKTTVIQYIAELAGKELVVLNMNEQTQCSDLIGGFKPMDLRQLAIPLYNRCVELFTKLGLDSKYATFKTSMKDAFDRSDYVKLISRLKQFCSFATSKIEKMIQALIVSDQNYDKYGKWKTVLREFSLSVSVFEKKVQQVEESFVFSFVAGALVDAIEKGKWILLDELNLAPSEVLQRLSGLLESVNSSLILSERGDVDPIKRNPGFRIFAAMNPATDVGKKSLVPSVRNRFSEFYVDELTDVNDLELIVKSYLESCPIGDVNKTASIVQFYLHAREKAATSLVDGGNKNPHYSLRTLCRALEFVKEGNRMKLSFRIALYEGLCMSFMTMLDLPSQAMMRRMIKKDVFDDIDVVMAYPTRNPGGTNSKKEDYVQVGNYWIKRGELDAVDMSRGENGQPPRFILTASVKMRLDDLCRAVLMEKCPVLLQGPTSSGKTSMIMYLAALTGHKCVRINNHEYTDLQDYTGIYISSPSGQLVFHEGLLVEALRHGYWVILDELNLAPSEVLEALNRLLDDNRELYIPETNTVVKPHPNFMLFATQNPPGKYGGRKVLSRAFRNRFLEMHIEDLPGEEMKEIIMKRSNVCERFAGQMIKVMERLQVERQNSNVFAGKDGFITPRDLLRWGNRCPRSAEELAYHGYMLLAERLRREDERERVKCILEEVIGIKEGIHPLQFYVEDDIIDRMMSESSDGFLGSRKQESHQLWNLSTLKALQEDIRKEYENSDSMKGIPSGLKTIAITGTLQKLFKLIGLCLHYNEPVLLVGGTGCGKTTAVQLVAHALRQRLVILNCHAHTETSDILGGQRPSRTHDSDAILFKQGVIAYLPCIYGQYPHPEIFASRSIANPSIDDYKQWILSESPGAIMSWLVPIMQARSNEMNESEMKMISEIKACYGKYQTIFIWQDGPLLNTMKSGDIFLLDEISLAEDAVLERMNSILENERQITVPEKGGDCIEVYTADERFRILGTMNPGGDFGKKELSAALRNRFTEIWVSSLNGLKDLRDIMKDRILMKEKDSALFQEANEMEQDAMVNRVSPFIDRILQFIRFYNELLNQNTTTQQNRTEATSRDILSIIDFMKLAILHLNLTPAIAFTEAIQMILLDGLGIGTNMNSATSTEYKKQCYDYMITLLSEQERMEVNSYYSAGVSLIRDEERFGLFPYFIRVCSKEDELRHLQDYHFDAPTTSNNLKRVLRALQLHKPILLEGSPGVGKTSLIMAIAKMIGQRIVRINLSEQTDMADLLGSDLPIPLSEQTKDSSGKTLQFQWSDGVLLNGIKTGAWILLDELNLASQQVLEGLNSCLDHRASVYIPELDREYQCPPSFQIFACQNPIEEGGGRKGLPRSFINRFARVYVDTLKEEDMILIGKQLFYQKINDYYGSDCALIERERIDSMIEKMVRFVVSMDASQNCGKVKNVSSFEFNLRDIFRWCDLMLVNQSVNEFDPSYFLPLLFIQRIRENKQRDSVVSLYNSIFSTCVSLSQCPSFHITNSTIKIGHALAHRMSTATSSFSSPLLRQSLPYLESLLFAIQNKLPCLLIGESGTGKSYALQTLAAIMNTRISEYNMNTTTDATEILGCFEQVEVTRHYSRLLKELVGVLQGFLWKVIISNSDHAQQRSSSFSSKRLRLNSMGDRCTSQSIDVIIEEAEESKKRQRDISPRSSAIMNEDSICYIYELIAYIENQVSYMMNNTNAMMTKKEDILGIAKKCEESIQRVLSCVDEEYREDMRALLQPAFDIMNSILAIHQRENHVSFEWIDGSLLEAIIRGNWVVFDNVNFCNASVLDRLNSLLENNGYLLINECGLVDGKERVLYPHNNFRIFFVMNPSFGEISRAMRNRCVEIFFPKDTGLITESIVPHVPPSLWDEFCIVNARNLNDYCLVACILQIYDDIKRLYNQSSMVKLNSRYLERMSSMIVEELEDGKDIKVSIEKSVLNVFPLDRVKEYCNSGSMLKVINEYLTMKSLCNPFLVDCMYANSMNSTIEAICNHADSIQPIRECILLNSLVYSYMHIDRVAMMQRWLEYIPSLGSFSVYSTMFKQIEFYLQRNVSSSVSFSALIIVFSLLFIRSKLNLTELRLLLRPSMVLSTAMSLTEDIVDVVRCILTTVHNTPVYCRYKAVEQRIYSYVCENPSDHIILFSNNFDDSLLCSISELLNELPLFVSRTDPIITQIHKRITNCGLLKGDEQYLELIQSFDCCIDDLNRMVCILPVYAVMNALEKSVMRGVTGKYFTMDHLKEMSPMELSILIGKEMIDGSQMKTKSIACCCEYISALSSLYMSLVEVHYTPALLVELSQSIYVLMQIMMSTSYESAQSTSSSFYLYLIAFMQRMNAFMSQYHQQTLPNTIAAEVKVQEYARMILEDLHVVSNIDMDNDMWRRIGKPLVSASSETYSKYIELMMKIIDEKYTYIQPLRLSELRESIPCALLYLSKEDRSTLVESIATVVYLNNHLESSNVLSTQQLFSMIENCLQQASLHFQDCVLDVDTSFDGSVEIEEEHAVLHFIQDSALKYYHSFVHSIVFYPYVLQQQAQAIQMLSASSLSTALTSGLASIAIPVEQLILLKQLQWMRDPTLTEEQKQQVISYVPAYHMNLIRRYLEGFWEDAALGYRLFEEDSNEDTVDYWRDQYCGSGRNLVPWLYMNIHSSISALLCVSKEGVRSSRNRIEYVEEMKRTVNDWEKEISTMVVTMSNLERERAIVYSVIVNLIQSSGTFRMELPQDLSNLSILGIVELQEEMQKCFVPSMSPTHRYASLVTLLAPPILRLLFNQQSYSKQSVELTFSLSCCWILLGILLFNALLPSSILDPLLQDYIQEKMLLSMNENILDVLFILSYNYSFLNGDIAAADDVLYKDLYTLYEQLLRKNENSLHSLEKVEFSRSGGSSFEQLYCVLYGFGSSLININRLSSLLERMMACIAGRDANPLLEETIHVVKETIIQLKASPFILNRTMSLSENMDVNIILSEEKLLQSSIQSYKQSLLRSYASYQDIIDPILLSIVQIQHGLRYLSTMVVSMSSSLSSSSDYYKYISMFSTYPLKVVTIHPAVLEEEMTGIMNHALTANKPYKAMVFRSLLTQILLYNMSVLRKRGSGVLYQFIWFFTNLWSQQRDEEKKRMMEEAKSVEYRARKIDIEDISNNTEEIERAYREQFPDYQLLFDEEAQQQAQAQAVDVSSEVKEMKESVFNEYPTFDEKWKITSSDIAYVYTIIQYLVNETSKASDSGVDLNPVRKQVVFLNNSIINRYSKEVEELVLSDFERDSSLLLVLELEEGKRVLEGDDLSSLLSSSSYSFHHSSNLKEVEECIRVLRPLKKRTFELLITYPTHAFLQFIYKLIDRILALPIVTPLNVILSGIEVLWRKMHDWEVTASKNVSMEENIKQVNALIIRWRKLELDSWDSFLDEEESKASVKATSDLCTFYSLLLPPNRYDRVLQCNESTCFRQVLELCEKCSIKHSDVWVSLSSQSILRKLSHLSASIQDTEVDVAIKSGSILGDASCDYTSLLIEGFDSYLRGSQLLEYSSRLSMLLILSRFIHLQLQGAKMKNTLLELNMNILYNTARMYSVFLPSVKEYIQELRQPIEKKLKDQVKLGKWDDQSYFALYETVQKIHRQLFRLIYEYRDYNNMKVSEVLDKYLSGELSTVDISVPSKEKPEPSTIYGVVPYHVKQMGGIDDAVVRVLAPIEASIEMESASLVSISSSSAILSRIRSILGSSVASYMIGYPRAGTEIEEMAVSIITTAIELRKEEKYIVRKQKSFSSLLNHLKEQGISSLEETVPTKQRDYGSIMRLSVPEMKPFVVILKKLCSLSSPLQHDMNVLSSEWAKADVYYYKDYLLLNSLRMDVKQQVSDQLTLSDIKRCVGYSENLMLNVLQERECIQSLCNGVSEIYELLKYMMDDMDKPVDYCSCADSVMTEFELILGRNIEVVDEVLYCINEVHSFLDTSISISECLQSSRNELNVEYNKLIPDDSSSSYKLFIRSHSSQVIGSIQRVKRVLREMMETIMHSSCYINKERLHSVIEQWKNDIGSLDKMNQLLEEGMIKQTESIDVLCDDECKEMRGIMVNRMQLVKQIMLTIQGCKRKSDTNKEKGNNEEECVSSYQELHNDFLESVFILSLGSLKQKLECFTDSIAISHPRVQAMSGVFIREVAYLLEAVLVTSSEVLMRGVVLNKAMGKLEYVVVKLFKEIVKKGFCLPPKEKEEKKKKEEEMQDGTGMGEGQGDNDVTDQLDNKDQLDGIKGEKKEEHEEKSEEEPENTGMDVEDDFDGEMENVKEEEEEKEEEEDEEEEEEEDRDREMGDLDEEDNQEVLDEKLWDEKEDEKDEKEKVEQDEKQENQVNTDEMTTKEDEKEQEKQEEKQEEQKPNQEESNDPIEDNDPINDLNEQEYEDDHHMKEEEEAEEAEDLPEDMEIEEEGEEEEDGEEEDGEEEMKEDGEEEMEEMEEGQEEENQEEEKRAEEMDVDGAADEEEEEVNVEDPNEEEEEKKEEKKPQKKNDRATEGVADEEGEDDVIDKEEKEVNGESKEKEEKKEEDENEGGDEGEMEEGVAKENEDKPDKEEEDDVNPYKDLEKAMRKWEEKYERMEAIPKKENQEEQEEQEEQEDQKDLGASVKQEKNGQEVLAPSLMDIEFKNKTENEKDRVEMDVEENNERQESEESIKEEEKETESKDEQFPEEEEEENRNEVQADQFASDLYDKVKKEGSSNETIKKDENTGVLKKEDIVVETEAEPILVPYTDEDSYINMNIEEMIVNESIDSDRMLTANEIWKEYLASTSDLSSRLSEQLRLLMEPTKASKLSGDYKTGKRINMRKVIPFIASNYRKDKIWLRRSHPSQREYQIMLVIDDSESMKQNNTDKMTFKTVALIGSALSQLEVGQIGVMSFGESIRYIHQLGTPFTSQSGSSILTRFTFSQNKTDFEACLESLIAILVQSRLRLSGAAKRAIQIAFLLSDGRISSNRERIAKLLRDAEENNILIVLLIIDDTLNPDDSILKLKTYTGRKGHAFESYLANYPFPYYLVIRSVQTLPEILSDALTQWFEMISSV